VGFKRGGDHEKSEGLSSSRKQRFFPCTGGEEKGTRSQWGDAVNERCEKRGEHVHQKHDHGWEEAQEVGFAKYLGGGRRGLKTPLNGSFWLTALLLLLSGWLGWETEVLLTGFGGGNPWGGRGVGGAGAISDYGTK